MRSVDPTNVLRTGKGGEGGEQLLCALMMCLICDSFELLIANHSDTC